METEAVSLTWNEFQSSATKAFRKMEGDLDFADVTLACKGGKQLKAHKVILSSCSEFFKTILVGNPHQHPLIFLTGVQMEQLRSLVRFMYSGEVQVANGELEQFLDTANLLEIEGLQHNKAKEKKEEAKVEESMFNVEKMEADIEVMSKDDPTANDWTSVEEDILEGRNTNVKLENLLLWAH